MPNIGRILVTGAQGQLGRKFVTALEGRYDVAGVGRGEMDITKARMVDETFARVRPQVVIHAAAMTDVDACERRPDDAIAVNVRGTENVAEACRRTGARLVYISTDYVFDGCKGTPYVESDTSRPVNVYGETKLEGERVAHAGVRNVTTARVSWVYGGGANNFARIIVGKAKDQRKTGLSLKEPIRIVSDQYGSPTWTGEIVRQVLSILEHDITGIVHVTAEGGCSRFRMAQEIFDTLELKVISAPCPMKEFAQDAERPIFTVLDNKRLREAGLSVMRPWRTALREFVQTHREELLS